MHPSIAKLGIIAGAGDLPERIVAACRDQGRPYFVLALDGQGDAERFGDAPRDSIRLGEVGKGLEILRQHDVEELVMAGKVKRPSISQLRPDGWSAKFIAKAGTAFFGNDSLMSALAKAIEAEGFRIVAPETVLTDLIAEAGQYSAAEPDETARSDIARAFEVARLAAAEDFGQGAIVQQGVVLGIEAVEGTDALLVRCGGLRLDGPGGVLAKVSRPGQERRIDLPTIGTDTIRNAAAAGLRGIAVEAGSALIVDAPAVAREADAAGLFVIAMAIDSDD